MCLNKKNEFPRLLVITVNSWSDKLSSGNTISNHFGNWDKSKISNLYLRDGEIDNECCETYFRISERDIFNSLFSKIDLGVEFKYSYKDRNKSKIFVSSKFLNFLIRIRPTIILLFRELYWKIGFIKKKKLNDFLKKQSPQIIHIHSPSFIYGHRVLHYCHKVTKAKIIVFYGDDNYSYKNYWPLSLLYQFILRFWIRKTISISSTNYAATPELCDYYSNVSKKEFKILYKGITILPPIIKKYSKPLKIVYAGNLLYGRWQTLSLISKAIEEISLNKNIFNLTIYTGTPLSKEKKKRLIAKNSFVLNAIPYYEVKKILENADIVLHVEAFDKKNMKKTMYSFSTKITDSIQSGSCIMGVGPTVLASINFLEKSKSAIVVSSYDEIVGNLMKISSDCNILSELSNKMYQFSKDKFDLNTIRNNIYNDIMKLLEV